MLKQGFDLSKLLPFPKKIPNGMKPAPRQRRSGWVTQLLLGAWVLGLGTGTSGAQFPYPLGDIPLSPEAYQTNLQVIPRDRMAEIQAALPPAYNAADQGFVTPAKDQGNCGSCWAFAAAGAVESKLLMRGLVPQPDVSEQQQVSCNMAMWGCDGGSMASLLFWAPPPEPDNGPLPENIFPYTASDTTPCYNPTAHRMPYRVGNWHTLPRTIEAFKASLYEDGPSYWRYDVHADFSAFWDKAAPGAVYHWDGTSGFEGGHAVLLIGWDDTKQALLLKNSWGEDAGPDGNGTFWISYADLAPLNFAMANFDLEAKVTAIPTLSDGMLILVALSLFAAGTYKCRGVAFDSRLRPPPLRTLGEDNMKKSSPISFVLACGIAFGFPEFLPGKLAFNQVLAAESSAADQGFYFPGEFEEQEAVWMGWPVGDNKAGWSVKDLHVRLWAAMAPHLYVNVAVNPDNAEEGITYAGQIAEIREMMGKYSVPADRIRFYTIRHGDTWWRDMGPIYLIDGQGNRAVASFGFSVWGYESPDSPYSKQEEAVAVAAARLDGVEKIFKTSMVSEGGDREFNGKGVMIAVEAVERQRNPTLTLEQIEAEFKRVLGVKKIIWLKQGRYDDDLTFLGLLPNEEGNKELYTLTTTGGHIDEHVRFVGPNKLLYTLATEDEANKDPIAAENKKRFEENLKILQGATDQDGQPFELIPMPDAPTIIVTMGPGDGTYDYLAANDKMRELNRIPEGQPIQAILASSYLNFLVTNKVVLAPKFWKEGRPEAWKQLDEQARKTLQQAFPDREILTFDTSAINVGGGGIHCNTQQVPKARKN